jgi:hypothetical protein
MKLSPILSPKGLPVWSAGGRHAWKVGEHRGFVCSLEWVGNGRRALPCMVIWPASNVLVTRESHGMWVISRRAITEFIGFNSDLKCTGSVSEHCMREARESLEILGKDKNDKQALNALCDVVLRFAPDLVHMPVTPSHVRKELDNPPMWTVKATNKGSGQVLSETEV